MGTNTQRRRNGWRFFDVANFIILLTLLGLSICLVVRLKKSANIVTPQAYTCLVNTASVPIPVEYCNSINKDPVPFNVVKEDKRDGFKHKSNKYQFDADGVYEVNAQLIVQSAQGTAVVARLIKESKDRKVELDTKVSSFPLLVPEMNDSVVLMSLRVQYTDDFEEDDFVYVTLQQQPLDCTSLPFYPSNYSFTADCGSNYMRIVKHR